jgi:AcrR family transcriptional regulator
LLLSILYLRETQLTDIEVMATRRRGERHGNAKSCLLEAAERRLARDGIVALSLRGIAEDAGLSRQAPYNHFKDKEALLAALVQAGFEALDQAVRAANGPGQPPREALAGAAAAYIGFAAERQSLFRLMFAREVVDITNYPSAQAAAARTYAALRAFVVAAGGDKNTEFRSLAAWSLVHGYATLSNELGATTHAPPLDVLTQAFADMIVSKIA